MDPASSDPPGSAFPTSSKSTLPPAWHHLQTQGKGLPSQSGLSEQPDEGERQVNSPVLAMTHRLPSLGHPSVWLTEGELEPRQAAEHAGGAQRRLPARASPGCGVRRGAGPQSPPCPAVPAASAPGRAAVPGAGPLFPGPGRCSRGRAAVPGPRSRRSLCRPRSQRHRRPRRPVVGPRQAPQHRNGMAAASVSPRPGHGTVSSQASLPPLTAPWARTNPSAWISLTEEQQPQLYQSKGLCSLSRCRFLAFVIKSSLWVLIKPQTSVIC